MDQWKTIEPGVWRPKKTGDSIVGILVNKEPRKKESAQNII
jgi:hypothetical protein